MIGRADLLRQRPIKLAKTDGLDLSFLTTFAGPSGKSSTRRTQEVHSNGPVLDDRILADPEVMDAIKNEKVGIQAAFCCPCAFLIFPKLNLVLKRSCPAACRERAALLPVEQH